jgi:hypothetical protein
MMGWIIGLLFVICIAFFRYHWNEDKYGPFW